MRKSGILIGRVSHIEFDKDDTGVLVTIQIDGNRTVYHDEKCRIVNSLIGIGSDTVLEFCGGPGPAPTHPSPTAKESTAKSPAIPPAPSSTWNKVSAKP